MPEPLLPESSVCLRRPSVAAAIAIAAIPILTFIGGLTLTGWAVAGQTESAAPQVIGAEL